MQIERSRQNGNYQFWSDRHVDMPVGDREKYPTMSSNFLFVPSCFSPSSNSNSVGGMNFIEHHVSKMDTLAGVAIKYGVEVADIKRMNGLVTDLQMFALKTLQIPLPGRHPPSTSLSDGSASPRENSVEQSPPCQTHTDVLGSFQSLRLKSSPQQVSLAMSSLQGYYGLKTPNHKRTEEGMEMAVYRTGRAQYLEDGPLAKQSPLSDQLPSWHRKSRSLVNGFFPQNGELHEDVPVAEARDGEADKLNEKSIRRDQMADESGSRTPEMLLKEDNNGGSGYSAITGKGLSLRPKSTNRIALAADADSSWLNPIPATPGDSLMTNGFDKVRKSSSTSNLQDTDKNGCSSIWPSSKWGSKLDFQARSNATIYRPIFDGLPKPITGRRNKAALD